MSVEPPVEGGVINPRTYHKSAGYIQDCLAYCDGSCSKPSKAERSYSWTQLGELMTDSAWRARVEPLLDTLHRFQMSRGLEGTNETWLATIRELERIGRGEA